MTAIDNGPDPATSRAATTVWIVELETASEPRHIYGVYAGETSAVAAVVDLLTTKYVSRWLTSSVRIPDLTTFPTIADWHRAVLAAWTLVDALDIAIAWDEWEPQ